MLVTILTDGSFSRQYKRGAWACYIRADNFVIRKAGKIRGHINDNNLCELTAILQGLRILKRRYGLSDCEIVIRTDSWTSIKLIKGGSNNSKFGAILKAIAALIAKSGGVEFRHVRAHVWRESDQVYGRPQYYVQQWCDTAARRHLNQAIAKDKGDVKQGKRVPKKQEKLRRSIDTGYVKTRVRTRTPAYRRSKAKKITY